MNPPNGKKKKLIILFSIIFVASAILLGAHYVNSLTRVSTDDAYIEGRIHNIASKIPGTVKQVLIDDNERVTKGQLLVEIDPQDYELKVAEAQAALEAEKSRAVDAQGSIKTAMANLEIQEVSLNQATLDKQRAEALFKENVIPKERLEKTQTAFNLAFAQVKAASEQLEKAKSLQGLEESLIKQREAALNIAKLNTSYTKILAPTDGCITSKSVETGNQIQAGQPLMAVVALDDIWIVANYKETQLKRVKPGQRVEIKIDTYPGKIFTGKVESIMAGTGAVFSLFPPENALGNYVKIVQRIPVKIVLDKATDKDHVLRIGMSCEPTIIVAHE